MKTYLSRRRSDVSIATATETTAAIATNLLNARGISTSERTDGRSVGRWNGRSSELNFYLAHDDDRRREGTAFAASSVVPFDGGPRATRRLWRSEEDDDGDDATSTPTTTLYLCLSVLLLLLLPLLGCSAAAAACVSTAALERALYTGEQTTRSTRSSSPWRGALISLRL